MAYDNYLDASANPYVYGQDEFWRDDEELKRFDQSANPTQAAKQESGGFTAAPPPSSSPATQAWTRQNVNETLQRYGAPTQENLVKAVAENPWLGKVAGNGRIQDTQAGGSGETWDVIANLMDPTQAKHWQTLTGHTAAAKAAAAAKAGISSAGATSGSKSSSAAQSVVQPITGGSTLSIDEQRRKTEDEALRQQLITQLSQRAQQGLAIDRNDPNIRVQADAYAANEERARRNYLADIAEQAGPLANLRGEQRLAAERVGQRTGTFEAELVGRELTAKRAEIADALESMRGMLTTGQEMTLRKELALMDDAIKRLQIKNQSTQFGQNLSEQARQFNADLEFKNRQLAEQSKQAANQLGFNYDSFDWVRSPLNPANMPQS